jgi:site-specific DNA recombinase
MSTCFIYCRKSSEDKERQILSLDDQEKICTELAQDKGFVVLGVYRESKSAKRPDQRPEFSALLSRMLKNEAKHIICWKADRLCRNAKEGGTLIDKVDYEGMQIITPTMDYDRNNSTFLFIEFGMATKFSKDLSDNVKRGMNTKVQNGWRPGRAPLGYKNDYYKPKGQKEVLPDLDKFDLCRKWWELMLSGTETVESSLEKISALGLKSNLTNQAVSKTEAFRYFRNIFYTGFFEYNGERHQGKHRAMITLDEYLRVQDIMNGRTRVHQVTNDFYFMKTLSCGECGSAITCDRKFKKYKNGTTQTFIYARCVKKKGPCSQHYVNAIELEKQVTEFINSLEIKPAFINWLRKMLKKRNDREFEFERAQKVKLTKRLDAILLEKKNVYGMKIEGLIGDEEYQAEKKRLLVEEKQTKDIIDSDGLEAWTQTMEEFLAFSSKIIKVFNGYDTEAKRMVLKIIGSNPRIVRQIGLILH